MKDVVFILVIIVLIGTFAFGQKRGNNKNNIVLEDVCPIEEGIYNCDGKIVSIKGKKDYAPHTMYFSLDKDYLQNSIKTKYGSIVLLSEQPITCRKTIYATGTLKIVKSDCLEGVKCIPSEYFVFVNSWKCK